MRKIRWSLETDAVGVRWEGEVEVEDDATEEEIDEIVKTEAFNYISWGWSEVK